ncbi:MAG: lysophospholipid acyltransferase family protein [Methylotenera sp.]
MSKTLLKIIAMLPLPIIHGLGIVIGWISYWSDKKFSRRVRNNLHKSKLAHTLKEHQHLVRLNVNETGKGILETLAIWVKSERSVLKWVKHCKGWHYVEEALATKKGIIFLTPHLGCYEITARYYAAKHPMTVLYRPARKNWLSGIMEDGRQRSKTTLAPTNLSGVRSLLKTLKAGQAVGILPDQVPDLGDGVWATYFNEPAYTMTLVSKLAEATNATVLLAYGERLPWGRGYVIHIEPLNTGTAPQDINNAIEHLVRKKPEQYLWSYRRFKQPQLSREKRAKINADATL